MSILRLYCFNCYIFCSIPGRLLCSGGASVFSLFFALFVGLSEPCWSAAVAENGLKETAGSVSGLTRNPNQDSVQPKTDRSVKKPLVQSVAHPGKSPSQSPVVAVEATKMNILYLGVDNPLSIAVNGVDPAQVKARFKSPNGTIIGQNGEFIAKVIETGYATIEVYREKNNVEELLGVKNFRVKPIPDPVPTWGVHRSGKITVAQFLEKPAIQLTFPNFEFNVDCDVLGFELTILTPETKEAISRQVNMNGVPADWIDMIKKLSPGSQIFIDEIRVKCPSGAATRNLGGLAFTIQ